ncbi:MAG: flagellar hook-associated protein FlgK [Verrucomicrobiae bacterium]|nr:flagellar hook-associated protein FlgK [Verrucomicrobiae bacterium]
MSGIFSSLSNASSALQTHGKMVELTGKNISNLNNPAYARQRARVGTIGGSSSGSGIQSGALVTTAVEQVRNAYVDKQILNEISYTSSLETQDVRLRQLLSALGESVDRVNDPAFISDGVDQDGSLRSSIDSFFNAFEAFSARPSDPSTKQVLFQSAQSLVENFNRMDQQLNTLEKSLDSEITGEVTGLNQKLEEIAELNRQIARVETSGSPGSANDLRDQRQEKLEAISEILLIDVAEVPGSHGQVSVTVRSPDGDPVNLVTIGSESFDITWDADNAVFKSVNTGAEIDLQAGRLRGLVEVKTETLANTREEIDSLANALATEVNEIYYQAFVPAGVDPAVPEISFFAQPTPPPSVSGIPSTVTAGSLALYQGSSDPAVTDSVPLTAMNLRASSSEMAGANELANAIAGLGLQDLASLGGMSFTEHAISTVVSLGQEIQNIGNRLDVQKNVEALLTEQRAQISGVSLDEEVANMVQFQRAFQASSRVFNVLSEMLETIVTGLR